MASESHRWRKLVIASLGILFALVVVATGAMVSLVGWNSVSRLVRTHLPLEAVRYGYIYVESPEVYTRERLVNDRFREEAWLLEQLEATSALLEQGAFDGPDGRRSRFEQSLLESTLALAKQSGDTAQTAQALAETVDALQAAGGPVREHAAAAVEPKPLDRYQDAQRYRDAIRQDLMQTQLDDRHDIRGNTLYRLNFDASIAPGSGHTGIAVIMVRLQEHTSLKDPNTYYRELYLDWRRSLQEQVGGAVDALEANLLSSQPLSIPISEMAALTEFVRTEFCSALQRMGVQRQPKPEDKPSGFEEDQILHACKYAKEVEAGLGGFIAGYTRQIQEQTTISYAAQIKSILESPSRPMTSNDGSSVAAVCKELNLPCKNAGDLDVKRNVFALRGAAAARCTRDARDEAEWRQLRSEFTVAGRTLPCPPSLRPQEDLLAAFKLLEVLDYLEARAPKLLEQIWPDGVSEREVLCLAGAALGTSPACLQWSSLGPPPDFEVMSRSLGLQVSGKSVRRRLADYMKSKLNDDLESAPVEEKLGDLVRAEVLGCEYGRCQLVLLPKAGESVDSMAKEGEEVDPVHILKGTLNNEARVFAYSVTPPEILERLLVEERLDAILRGTMEGSAGVPQADMQAKIRAVQELHEQEEFLEDHPVVVGFSAPPKKHCGDLGPDREETPSENGSGLEEDACRKQAVVGWLVRPTRKASSLKPSEFGERSRHYSLSTVVSVPSWWRGLSADVRAAWIDAVPVEERIVFDDVQCEQEHVQCYGYTFRVPGSVKEVNEVLRYEVRKEPYINAMSQQQRGPQYLEIGRRGSIILEGGRLWRGTVVTIGQQRASRITALPDMNGVIADFECVLPPAGIDPEQVGKNERRLTVPVIVWTSEGRTSTPYVVHLMPFAGSESNGDRPCFLPARTAGVSR